MSLAAFAFVDERRLTLLDCFRRKSRLTVCLLAWAQRAGISICGRSDENQAIRANCTVTFSQERPIEP